MARGLIPFLVFGWAACCLAQPAPAPVALAKPLTAQDEKAPSQVSQELFESYRKNAQDLLDHHRFQEALRGFEAALEIAQRLNSPADLAIAYRGLGQSHRYNDDYGPALEYYDLGVAAAEKSGDKPLLAIILRARGVALRALGRTSEAIVDDERSIRLDREAGEGKEVVRGLNNLAVNYVNLGDLRRAAEIDEQAIRETAAWPELADSLLENLADVVAEQGNLEAARGYLLQSIRGAEQTHSTRDLFVGVFNLGEVNSGAGRLNEALACYARALPLARELNSPIFEATLYLNRSAIYEKQQRSDLAVADLREGLRSLGPAQESKVSSALRTSLARVALARGDVAEAGEHAKIALAIARHLGVHDLLWQALLVTGQVSLAAGDRAQAQTSFSESIQEVELLRDLAGGDEQSMASFLNNDKIRPYHAMIRMRIEHGDTAAALEIAERAKARQLLDTVRFGKAEIQSAMSAAERGEEHRLTENLAKLDRRLAQDPAARKDWQAAQVKLAEFRAHLYSSHPRLAAQRGDAAPLTPAEAVELLPNERAALVEFVVTEQSVHVFVITRGEAGAPALTVETVPLKRDDLAREVSAFRDLLAARSFQYRPQAAALYKKLIGPVASRLRGKDTVAIVPDGPLWDLPFQALMVTDGAHWMERQTIFYTPSLTYLRETRRLRSPDRAPRMLLALGNPGSVKLATEAAEVDGLAKLYGADRTLALTGSQATKQAWMAQAPQYRILHVATHGISNPANPMYSWLSVAPARSGAPDDALEAREVLGMNLRADVAVLSACDTARGEVAAGEGLLGMSWAFLVAGAASTVVSQWAVDAESTTQLMLEFHRNLKPALDSGLGRARALRRAALSIMRDPRHQHPYYWAGFVEVGDGF